MTVSSQEYANLSDHVYKPQRAGMRNAHENEAVILEGVKYDILEHASNKENGYQGTIYQKTSTGEIIVAHRGTEQAIKDGLITDGGMILARSNNQRPDAIALTQRALERAQREGIAGQPLPVTITGHSLGGALAQISAHHFNLKGETFNAYGAVSLGFRLPEGGDKVVNHVMAGDVASASTKHYGQVRIYATQREIAVLQATALGTNVPSTPVALGPLVSSHYITNFINSTAAGKEHQSALNERAQERAQQHAKLISNYRNDTKLLRSVLTLGGRGVFGIAYDMVHEAQGDILPGRPSGRQDPPLPAAHPPSRAFGAPDAGEQRRATIEPEHAAHRVIEQKGHAVSLQAFHHYQLSPQESLDSPRSPSETDLLLQHGGPKIAKFHEQVKAATPHLNETEQARLSAFASVQVQKRRFDFAQLDNLSCFENKGIQGLHVRDMALHAQNPYTSFALINMDKAVQTPVQDSLTQMHNAQIVQMQAQEQNHHQGRGISM